MIENFKLNNVLSFHECDLDLGPLNIIIGANGVGKSNLIKCLQLAGTLANEDESPTLDFELYGFHSKLEEAQADVSSLEALWGTGGDGSNGIPPLVNLHYRGEWKSLGQKISRIVAESITAEYRVEGESIQKVLASHSQTERVIASRNKEKRRTASGADLLEAMILEEVEASSASILTQLNFKECPEELKVFQKALGGMRFYGAWDMSRNGLVREPQRAEQRQDILLANASNLSLFYNYLQTKSTGEEIESWVKKVYPRLKRISTQVTGNLVQLYFSEKGIRNPLPGLAVSDGTMQFLGLMCALFNPTPPSLICIEEPESSLHPDAIVILAQALREASEKTQIIITTHSEMLVSCFSDSPECVLVTERDTKTGETVFERLDSEELDVFLKDYTLGNLWAREQIGGGIEP